MAEYVGKDGFGNLITSLSNLIEETSQDEVLSEVLESLNMVHKGIMNSAKNLTKKVEVAEVMSPVIAYAYMHGMAITEAARTLWPVPFADSSQAISKEDWPNVGFTKYRIGNNVLTKEEFNILRTGKWLNDRVSLFLVMCIVCISVILISLISKMKFKLG